MRFSTIVTPGVVLMPALTGVFADLAIRQDNNQNDPQKSLTLDSRVIASGFANDGQDVPAAGQVPSLTSTNNFINFCLTAPNLPITNGKQITTGSCNPAPIGLIPSVDNMPSSKFTSPKNGDTIPANQAFTVSMAIKNMETGSFTNAQESYFAAPQQLNSQGQIIGHSHFVIEPLQSLSQTTPTDPKNFAFFKGLNNPAQNGILTADVDNGLPAGAYRLCSINTSSNHQPAIVPIAQHGSLDDCVYFTASANGAGAGTGAGAGAGTGTAATSSAAGGNKTVASSTTTKAGTRSTSTAAPAATTKATAGNSNNNNNNANANRGGRFRPRPNFFNGGRFNGGRRF